MSPLSKNWNPAFRERRKRTRKNFSWAPFTRSMGSDGEPWDTLWKNNARGGGSVHFTEMLKKFCRGVSVDVLENPQSRGLSAMDRPSVRLDDREIFHHTEQPPAIIRPRTVDMSAYQLYEHLKLPRFVPANDRPIADRRLISISDMNPCHVLALIETATLEEAPALKSAISNHLRFQAGIGATVSTRGYSTFQLEAHLPFLLLRPKQKGKVDEEAVANKPPRSTQDLACLGLKEYDMVQSHYSLVICGSDDFTWLGYGLADGTLSDDDNEDEDDGNDGHHDCEEGCDEDDTSDSKTMDFREDRNALSEVDSAMIQCPREYWARVLEIRASQNLEEISDLVAMLEDKMHHSRPTQVSIRRNTIENSRKALSDQYNETTKALDILGQINDVLSENIKSWETFSKSGDIQYFRTPESYHSSESEQHTYLSLSAIEAKFEGLNKCLRRVKALQHSFEQSAKSLERFLMLESNQAAKQSVQFSQLTTHIFQPFTLTTGYYGMPGTTTTLSKFCITLLLLQLLTFILFVIGPWLWNRSTTKWSVNNPTSPKLLQYGDLASLFGTRRRKILSWGFESELDSRDEALGDLERDTVRRTTFGSWFGGKKGQDMT